jgi:hypothetical protein
MHILSSLLILGLFGTFIIADEHSNDLENERVKRVAVVVDDIDFDNNERPRQSSARNRFKDQTAVGSPVTKSSALVLPPYHANIEGLAFDPKGRTCLLYLEAITILVLNKKTIGGVQQAYTLPLLASNSTYNWDESYAVCPSGTNITFKDTFNFTIDYAVNEPIQLLTTDKKVLMTISEPFQLTLGFVFNSGFTLTSAEISGLIVHGGQEGFLTTPIATVKGPATNTLFTNIRAYYGYNYACSGTPALLFEPPIEDANLLVGVILNNFQVQGVGVNTDVPKSVPYFGSKTADCVPTFNQGTWMGIIVTLILISVLIFAFLMLNSVQTMDRFDDPKQKQIVINFKE